MNVNADRSTCPLSLAECQETHVHTNRTPPRQYRDDDSCPTCHVGTLERKNVDLAVDRRRGMIQCELCGATRFEAKWEDA